MAQIKFIREYVFYGTRLYDIVYKSNRCFTVSENDCPSTARRFMDGKTPEKQYDRTFKREELIYK